MNTPPDDQPTATGGVSTTLKTKTNGKWMLKLGVVALFGFILLVWGLYDGLHLYPKRGEEHARFTLAAYLTTLDTEGRLTARRASVLEPAATLAELQAAAQLTPIEQDRRVWLTSLSRVRNLSQMGAERIDAAPKPADVDFLTTVIPDPRGTLEALETRLQGRTPPEPLAFYDIASQYVIAAVGGLVFFYIVYRFIRTGATTYTYQPREHRLRGPGLDVTPDQIAGLDKRLWHKYFVFIEFTDGREPQKIDLYRFVPLEDWLLEMEKLSPEFEFEAGAGDDVYVQYVDVRTGVVQTDQVSAAETPGPLSDDAGAPVRYPVLQDHAGAWYVIGKAPRATLRQTIDKGQLPGGQLYVDPETFLVDVREVRDDAAIDSDAAHAPASGDPGPDADSADDQRTAAPNA